ncbi:hypothetical protein IMSAG192_01332 [Muribaculaceae bacterium]|nr:hypothetical protein IMSAG192_01332 [Muribaculaceae bacterium]
MALKFVNFVADFNSATSTTLTFIHYQQCHDVFYIPSTYYSCLSYQECRVPMPR